MTAREQEPDDLLPCVVKGCDVQVPLAHPYCPLHASARVATPHQYEYRQVSGWWCAACDVPIRNEDCPANAATARGAS